MESEENMNCGNCRNALEGTENFCKKCGTKVEATSQTVASSLSVEEIQRPLSNQSGNEVCIDSKQGSAINVTDNCSLSDYNIALSAVLIEFQEIEVFIESLLKNSRTPITAINPIAGTQALAKYEKLRTSILEVEKITPPIEVRSHAQTVIRVLLNIIDTRVKIMKEIEIYRKSWIFGKWSSAVKIDQYNSEILTESTSLNAIILEMNVIMQSHERQAILN